MNTRKPTHEEVEANKELGMWWSYQGKQTWHWSPSSWVYWQWTRGDRWLPYDAIPDPTNQPTTKGRKV